MLPILRVIPVGGVFLAIAILILALSPRDGSRSYLMPAMAPASGALIARELHPEWRQFLLLAALQRADEINRLRELPDTPVRSAPPDPPAKAEPAPAVAAVPTPADAGPEDATGSIVHSPDAAMPVEIGETSSTELPVMPHEERPPVITPGRAIRQHEGNAAPEPAAPETKKPRRRPTRAKPAPPKEEARFNLLEALFGGAKIEQKTDHKTNRTTAPAPRKTNVQ